ncbi:MAG: RNA-binding protein [Alphaproteobacteria bacterium]|nr:RNA-binding protein [Alphaproteobacteria bacterium]
MADALRVDKFLWFARIVKTRALAQQLAEAGRIRIGGRILDRAHAPVHPGDVLSFALRGRVRVIRIERLPVRRGPPAEASLLYTEIGETEAEGSAKAGPVDEPTGARLGNRQGD